MKINLKPIQLLFLVISVASMVFLYGCKSNAQPKYNKEEIFLTGNDISITEETTAKPETTTTIETTAVEITSKTPVKSNKISTTKKVTVPKTTSAPVQVSKINIYNYSYRTSYSGYSTTSQTIISQIFDKINYIKSKNYQVTKDECIVEGIISASEDARYAGDFFQSYYTDRIPVSNGYCSMIFSELHNWYENGTLDYRYVIDAETLASAENVKWQSMPRVEQALSTLNEGSEYDKVVKIAYYIANHVTYNINYGDLTSALNGQTRCQGYALLFKAMCERIGIRCDYITGTSSQGGNHAWNRVHYSDGSVKYFDITWFDNNNGSYDVKYLNSSKPLHHMQSVNGGTYY